MGNSINSIKVIWQNYVIDTQVSIVFPFLKNIL